MQKKRVLFILPSMFGGGAERVVLTLLSSLDRSRYELILALVKKEGDYLELIPDGVEVIYLGVSKARYSLFKIAKLVKKREPDVVFTSLAHLNLLIAFIRPLFSKKIKFIARESNTVSQNNKRDKYPKVNDFLYKHFYKNFDLIITQAKAMREDLRDNFGIDDSKMVTIYNPVDVDGVQKRADEFNVDLPTGKYNLVAVGRLSEQKGFDMLLEIVSRLDDSYYLTILGEGEERSKLEKQIEKLGIKDRVNLAGFNTFAYSYMQKSDLFVLSSRYEGLPNVVLEANSLGKGVVAFDSDGGTGEIIEDGVNGYLVEPFNLEEFVSKIELARDVGFDSNMIINMTRDRFLASTIVKEYERAFSDT